MVLISLISKTPKTETHQGLLWSALMAHKKRPCRFPELTSIYLLKPVTAQAATVVAPFLLIVHLLSGHLS